VDEFRVSSFNGKQLNNSLNTGVQWRRFALLLYAG